MTMVDKDLVVGLARIPAVPGGLGWRLPCGKVTTCYPTALAEAKAINRMMKKRARRF